MKVIQCPFIKISFFNIFLVKIIGHLSINKLNKNSLKSSISLLFYNMLEEPMSSLITSNTV